MQWIGAAGMAVFVLTCAAVGVKLIALAIRSGGLAVWSCGLAFSLIAFLGYPLPVIAGIGRGTIAELNLPLATVGAYASAGGMCCFFVFTAHVFRSGVPWARALAALLAAAYLGVTTASTYALAVAPRAALSFDVNWPYGIAIQTLCLVCFAWISAEGLLQWRKSKRRLEIGLGDAVVSNRFLLWGLFGGSTTLMVVVLLSMQLMRINSGTHLGGIYAMAGFGVVSSVCAWLAFFPTKAYVARIRTTSTH